MVAARSSGDVASGVLEGGVTTLEGDPEATFEIGAITKVFTGVLLAEGRLRGEGVLNDPLDPATHRTVLPITPPPLNRRELAFALGLGRDLCAGVTPTEYEELVERARANARRAGSATRELVERLERAAGG